MSLSTQFLRVATCLTFSLAGIPALAMAVPSAATGTRIVERSGNCSDPERWLSNIAKMSPERQVQTLTSDNVLYRIVSCGQGKQVMELVKKMPHDQQVRVFTVKDQAALAQIIQQDAWDMYAVFKNLTSVQQAQIAASPYFQAGATQAGTIYRTSTDRWCKDLIENGYLRQSPSGTYTIITQPVQPLTRSCGAQ